MEKPDRLITLDIKIRRVGLVLLYLIGAILLLFLFRELKPLIQSVLTILSPFMVALIIAYVFNPVANWLQKRFSIGRISAILITYGMLLLIVILFFVMVVPILYDQVRQINSHLRTNLPSYIDRAAAWLQLRLSQEEVQGFINAIQSRLSMGGTDTVDGQQVVERAFSGGRILSRAVLGTVGFFIGFAVFVSFVIVITFYFLLDYHRMEHIARVLLPEEEESKVFSMWKRIDLALGGFLRGQLIVASIIAILYTTALWAMGMGSTAILVGLMAGVGNLVPYLGPIIGGVPAALWVIFGQEYATGQEKLIGLGLVLLLTVLVQSLDGFFLQPRIVGQSANLHPLYVLLALLIGAQFGLGGMILAVPLAIMVRVVIKDLYWDPMEAEELENKRLAQEAEAAEMSDNHNL